MATPRPVAEMSHAVEQYFPEIDLSEAQRPPAGDVVAWWVQRGWVPLSHHATYPLAEQALRELVAVADDPRYWRVVSTVVRPG